MAVKNTTARYKDLSLTFRPNPVTGDVVKLLDDDAVKASVVNLVLTMFYEVPFHPEQGSAVMHSLFEDFSQMTAIKIRASIIEVIQNFEPRVQLELDGVLVLVNPDLNGYSAQIIYRIINRPEPVVVNLFLEKRR